MIPTSVNSPLLTMVISETFHKTYDTYLGEQPPISDIIVTTILLLEECHGLTYLWHHHCIVIIIIAIIMDHANDHPHL